MNKESRDINKEKDDRGLSRRDFLKGALGLALSLAVLGQKQEVAAQTETNRESPFNPETQKEILEAVAKEMKIQLKAEIPSPVVIKAESLGREEFNKAVGFDAEGKVSNFFVPPNVILLIAGSQVHNLAHELTHYIQYNYKGIREDPSDTAELEAVVVQDKFRNYRPQK